MPIPAFDGILNILPPHLGDPRHKSDVSPYECTMSELCARFATSPERKAILDGFLKFREELLRIGIAGFQWLDGSFLEDIESQEGRSPKDIDAITFVATPLSPQDLVDTLNVGNPLLFNRSHVKAVFSVDHFWVSLGMAPDGLVDQARYWYGLFSHRRDRLWKGMLVVKLVDRVDDAAAQALLRSKP